MDDARIRRVTILSPQDVVVRGFTSMLAEDPDRACVVGAPDEADVVLYDVLFLNGRDGTDLDRLVQLDPHVTVLAVARDLRPDLLARALESGAHGFVPLEITVEPLLRAVATADRTGTADGPWTPQGVVADGHLRGHDVDLTTREHEVLALIAQGHSNLEIARRCYLSINSVKTYVRSAYRKIGVTSRSQAVIWCLTHGFAASAAEPTDPPTAPAPTAPRHLGVRRAG